MKWQKQLKFYNFDQVWPWFHFLECTAILAQTRSVLRTTLSWHCMWACWTCVQAWHEDIVQWDVYTSRGPKEAVIRVLREKKFWSSLFLRNNQWHTLGSIRVSCVKNSKAFALQNLTKTTEHIGPQKITSGYSDWLELKVWFIAQPKQRQGSTIYKTSTKSCTKRSPISNYQTKCADWRTIPRLNVSYPTNVSRTLQVWNW